MECVSLLWFNINDTRFNFYKDDFAMHKLCKLQNQRQNLSVAVLGKKRPKY